MQVFTWSNILSLLNTGKEDSFFSSGCGISVGSFDGLHKGHRVLINTLVSECKKNNVPAGVVTFKRPLPSIKHHSDYLGDISTLEQRLKLLESLGVNFAIVVDFDDSFASMLGTDFFSILMNVCNMKLIAEGIDFRCGYKGSTDSQAIKYFGEKNNIKTFFVDPVFYDEAAEEERISSSYIRSMINKGFLTTVEKMLERSYVIDNSQLTIENYRTTQVLPPDGVYHCHNPRGEEVRVTIKNKTIKIEGGTDNSELIF